MPIQQSRSRRASLWQSALDEATAKQGGGGAASFGPKKAVKRPMDQDIVNNAEVVQAIEKHDFSNQQLPNPPPPKAAAGFKDSVKFCSTTAFKLAEARVKAFFTNDDSEVRLLQQQLGAAFGACDPKWSDVIEIYFRNRVAQQKIPYRPYNDIGEYVIDDPDLLPDSALIAFLADWGTGEDPAKH